MIALIALFALGVTLGTGIGIIAITVSLFKAIFRAASHRNAAPPARDTRESSANAQEFTDQEFFRLMTSEWRPGPNE